MNRIEKLIPTPHDSYRFIIKAAILAYAFSAFALITADPDLWGHVRFGEEIWNTNSIPQADSFSYTARGKPWINHEWLAEIIFFKTFDLWGSTGLLLLKLALGLLIIHLLTPDKTGTSPWARLIVLILAIPVMAPGFMTRPHLFTYLCLALLVTSLRNYFAGNNKSLALTPALMFFWGNSHGGVVAGMGILAAVTALECVRGMFSGDRRFKILLLCCGLSAVAVLFNPYGCKLWIFFYQSLGIPRPIGEWGPVTVFDARYIEYKIMTALFVLTLFTRKRQEAWEPLIIAAALVYGFKHQRHTVLAAIILIPYLSQKLSEVFGLIAAKKPEIRLSADFHKVITIVLAVFIASQLYSGLGKYHDNSFAILVEPQTYPSYAVQFMNANGISGNVSTPLDWGEYLIWNLKDSKVSIDGRFRTVYPEDIIRKNLNFSYGGENWKQLLDDYPTDIILTRRQDHTHDRVAQLPDWQKIYADPISLIFIKKTDPPSPLLRRSINSELIQPKEPPSFDFP